MRSQLNRFNWLARHYDVLSRLVFGKAILQSQLHFLQTALLRQHGKILIIGGGSGEILEEVWKANPTCCIWYVEASSEMLKLAAGKVRREYQLKINFIHGTEDNIPEEMLFDVVIANFVLDLFPDMKVTDLCHDLSARLHPSGLMLVSDFVDGGKWWQSPMLWAMYGFFRVMCKVEATSLPRWEAHLRFAGMYEQDVKYFFGGFIKSAVYRKRTNAYADPGEDSG